MIATRFRIPDLCVLLASDPRDPIVRQAPFLCVEILSPEDRPGTMPEKCEAYHAWGVPFCWVIDPEKQTAWQYPSGGEPEHLDRNATLTAGDLHISLAELFSELAR